jgi:hypothetical protein
MTTADRRPISRAHRWTRGDGTLMSCTDLTTAVPMTLDELDDIVRLVDLVEEWLLLDETAVDQLTYWLDTADHLNRNVQHVVDELGTISAKLHQILRAGIPDTGHAHPPTT